MLSLSLSSKPLKIRPALLYSDTESLVGFLLIPKRMILNDLGWQFQVKLCFRAGTDKPILSAAAIKVYADIRRASLERMRQATVESCVNARAAVACILE